MHSLKTGTGETSHEGFPYSQLICRLL